MSRTARSCTNSSDPADDSRVAVRTRSTTITPAGHFTLDTWRERTRSGTRSRRSTAGGPSRWGFPSGPTTPTPNHVAARAVIGPRGLTAVTGSAAEGGDLNIPVPKPTGGRTRTVTPNLLPSVLLGFCSPRSRRYLTSRGELLRSPRQLFRYRTTAITRRWCSSSPAGVDELHEAARDVLSDGTGRDDERLGDGGVGATFGHEGEEVALAGREAAEGVHFLAAGDALADDLRIEGGAAGGDALEGLEVLDDIGDPVLEEVADLLSSRPAARSRSAPRRTVRARAGRRRASAGGARSLL